MSLMKGDHTMSLMKHASLIICAVALALCFGGAVSAQQFLPPGGSPLINPPPLPPHQSTPPSPAAAAEDRPAGDPADGRAGTLQLCTGAAPFLQRPDQHLPRSRRRQWVRPERACDVFALLRQSVIAAPVVRQEHAQ